MGIGTGGMEPVNVAMIGEWWQKENRGFAVGTHHTGFPLGQFFGPLIIGGVLYVATWREAFLFIPLVAVPIVIIQIVLARRRNLERVNRWIREQSMTPSVEVGEIRERDREDPFRVVRIAISNRNVLLAIAMTFCFLFAEFGIDTFLTVYLTDEIGIALGVAATISASVAGIVIDNFGFAINYVVLAIPCLIALIPLAFMRATRVTGGEAAQE